MLEADDAQTIAAELLNVFPARRSTDFGDLVNSRQGFEPLDVERDFAEQLDWTLLKANEIDRSPDGLASALSFLSDAAVCFYIPAYLSADLRGELQQSEPVFALTHGFGDHDGGPIRPRKSETWREYATERWRLLSLPQVLAVVHYLEFKAATDDIERSAIRQALANYWYQRAADVESARR